MNTCLDSLTNSNLRSQHDLDEILTLADVQVGQGVGLSPPVVGDLQPAVASLPHYRKAAPLRTHCGLHRRGAGGQAAQEQGDVEGAEFDRSWPCRVEVLLRAGMNLRLLNKHKSMMQEMGLLQ